MIFQISLSLYLIFTLSSSLLGFMGKSKSAFACRNKTLVFHLLSHTWSRKGARTWFSLWPSSPLSTWPSPSLPSSSSPKYTNTGKSQSWGRFSYLGTFCVWFLTSSKCRDFGETLLIVMVLAPLASSMEIQEKSADYARYKIEMVYQLYQEFAKNRNHPRYTHIWHPRYSHPMASSKYRAVSGIQFEAIYETWPDAIMAKTVSFLVFSLLNFMLCIFISGGGRADKIGWKIKSETRSSSNSAEVQSFPFVQINSLRSGSCVYFDQWMTRTITCSDEPIIDLHDGKTMMVKD